MRFHRFEIEQTNYEVRQAMSRSISVASRAKIQNKFRLQSTILLLLLIPVICPQAVFGSSDNVPKGDAGAGKKLVISSVTAQQMLKQSVTPVYPPMAKAAHVSGTVILRVTIAKDGSIADLKVVSGPAMLQQAAFNAVQKWHYKPFLVDNQPTDVETTINVVFGMGS